ncbi:MAG TPA: S-layer homology domain-containing protein [Candidatus Paenibacillus intestinavium]|nr:S-layer homology domain-containing protein [Candidatus Paenibacillus intestinavium]
MNRKYPVRNKLISIAMTAILVFGMCPLFSLPTAAAATVDTIYAATYMGAKTSAETTLPDQIDIGGESKSVSWLIGDDLFAVPYETVTVSGMTEDNVLVVANVEVIPPPSNPLIYFVDSGRGGDSQGNGPSSSPLFEAVKELSGNELLNEAPDQRYVTGTNTWGFDDSVHKVKNSKDGGHTDPSVDPSIWVVGLRADPSTNHIIYKLEALEAGTYTLSSGFHDWYGNRSRTIGPVIEYQDKSGETQLIQLDQFNTNATQSISSEFTIANNIDTAFPITLTYAYVSGEKPILSWFAIAKGKIKDLITDAKQVAASIVHVLLDGNDIKAENVNGLTFKGFGVLSANSTSALLMDYKSEQPEVYAEMLKILFGGDNPLMTHVKIEMGNDRNNSTGPDPATMRTEDEEANVTRHPGFQLAADAKAVNPDLKISVLRWNAPAWANNNNDKIYTWYKNTILAAYREYGYMVDYVNPHINEHAPDYTWTKQFAARVKADIEGFTSPQEQALYNQIKAVISDEVGIGSFGGSMVSDATLRAAAPIAGYHYNTDDDGSGNFKRLAEQFDIEVWNSEAQATFSNSSFRPNNNTKDPTVAGTGIGGTGSALEMGNTIIKGFVNSRRTHFIYQPAIGSFYEGGQYSFKELLSARDPWSGWIHYDAGLVILQHFNRFANVGWENESNTAAIWRGVPQASYTGASGTNPVSGRNGTPSYMTLAAPDKSDFSTVIVNDSENARTYKLQTVNMSYAGAPELEAWETLAANEGEAFNSNHMQYRGQITADGSGTYTIKVKPYSIVTVSTLDNKDNKNYNTPLPVEGERTVLDTDSTGKMQNRTDHVLYADNFDYSDEVVPVIGADGQIIGTQSYIESRGGTKSVIPRYTHDRNGAFEAYLDEQTGNYVLRQQLDRAIMGLGGTWNGGDPVTAIGDNRWTNYKASVDVSFENNSVQSGANYAAIGARYQGGGSSHSISGTPYVLKFWFDGGWQLLVNNSNVASGNVATGVGGVTIPGFDIAHNAWHNLAIEVVGNKILAYIDGVRLTAYTDPNPKLSGRVDLASGYYHVRFDNLLVETVDGFIPYYTELLDDLEMHDLALQPANKLIYNELWNQTNGQGMFHYQRSLSTSKGAGAELTYTFTGTGLDILGPNNGSAKLEVTIDGQIVIASAHTIASKELYQAFALRGLEYGEHTVQIKVLSGTLVIDAIGVVASEVSGTPDVTALQGAVVEVQNIEREEEFTEYAWQLFEAARDAAMTALDDPAAYRLDQEGTDQLILRLVDAQNQLLIGDVRDLSSPHYVATYVGEVPNLPSKIEATQEDGTTTLVSVRWNLQDVSFNTPYETVAVSGSLGSLTTVAFVEVVPKDIAYFVDLNGTVGGSLGYSSPAYESVAALIAASGKQLLNDKPDQQYDVASGWGHDGRNASGASSINYKGIVGGAYSKQSTTGLYAADQVGAKLSYTFANLPSGEYTLTLGSYSWWASYIRTAEVSLVHDNASSLVDTIILDSSSYSQVKSYPVTMEESGTLKLELKAVQNAQSPMLSFVGIAPVQVVEPEVNKAVLQSFYDANKDKQFDNYTTVNWNSFQSALTGALDALNDEAATQEQVDEALQTLADAIAGLELEEPVPDTTKPVITLLGEVIVQVENGAAYSDAGATAVDDVDSDISGAIVTTITLGGNIVAELDTTVAGTYTYYYNVIDEAGNAANEVIRIVIVEASSEEPAPSKTVLHALYDTHKDKQNENYTSASWSNFQSALAGALSVIDDESATQEQIDEALQILNTAFTVLEQEVPEPQPDTTKPVITLLGEVIVQVKNGVAYTDAGATALDDQDGDITSRIVTTITRTGNSIPLLDTKMPGTYMYHYNVGDLAGNVATEVTRTVIVAERKGTSNPSTPPEATTPPIPSSTKVLTEGDFNGAMNGTNTIEIADEIDTVLIPGNIAAISGDNSLRLIQNNLTIEFTKELLDKILDIVPGAKSEGAQIRLTTGTASIEDIMRSINDSTNNGTVRFAPASDLFVLNLEIITADGAAIPVSYLVEPLILDLKVVATADLDVVGMYRIAADGTVEYIGGTIDDGVLIVSLNHLGQLAVLEYNKDFVDISETFWASEVIRILTSKHIINGVSDQQFNPHGNVTRAEFAAMIARALNLGISNSSVPAFRDLSSSDWFTGAINAVSEAGIVRGRGTNVFMPNAPVTREEMAVMIIRAYEYANGQPVSGDVVQPFSDWHQISSWALDAVNITREIGLISGRGQNQFAPQEMMTRAESAQIVYNLLKKL